MEIQNRKNQKEKNQGYAEIGALFSYLKF